MADAHKNFAISTVATAPSPATSGTSLVVASGEGALFPAAPFNVTIWPVGAAATAANAEVARATAIATDTFTITRAQEGSAARTVVVGDQIAATITAKTLTDVEAVAFNVIALKTADETVTASTTLQDDNHLLLPISASATERWFFETYLLVNAANVTMDFKFGFTVPTSATMVWHYHVDGGASVDWRRVAVGTTATTPFTEVSTGSLGTRIGDSFVSFAGWIIGGGTAGNVQFQWAQNTSDAGNLIVKSGSLLRAKRVAT